jgi:prepilin-type N-terminal cleavage/methylation domain-containing protein
MKYNRGFTVAEVVVVVAIVGLLASAVIFNAARGNARSRDVDRQADLRTLQSAVELYKQRHGRYPARCANSQSWSGQAGTQYACTDGSSQYIIGLAPEFIPTLPVDSSLNGTDSGYVYAVNAAGTVYKLAARRTVEADTTLSYTHPFKYCDSSASSQNTQQPQFYATAPICNAIFSLTGTGSGNFPVQCQDGNSVFETSYAVWGGNAAGSGTSVGSSADNTEDIICL